MSTTTATIWFETDGPCEIRVLGHAASTFRVHGHHYALVIVEGLPAAGVIPYDVTLDGVIVWPPPDSPFPPPVIRTVGDGPTRVVFGSCRAAAPHEPPWSSDLATDRRGRGVDALRAYALRMATTPPALWPHLAIFLGDQIYADDSSPETRERIRARRQTERRAADPPVDRVADFEEYTWLYHESWRSDAERWFFSVVPSTMIFDDHEMIDDWNISNSWLADIEGEPWWTEHLIGGLVSYWIYQHLGNLSPDEIRSEGMLDAVSKLADAEPYLREWAQRCAVTPGPGGYRFSYARDLGRVRLVVVDCRNARVLEPKHRSIVGDEDAQWFATQCHVETDHLLIATSLPVFVTGALHDLQVWNEAVCDGAWGRIVAKLAERLRRAVDLDDWPAFRRSFDGFTSLVRDVGSTTGKAPFTINVVSGDIHFSYVAAVHFPAAAAVSSRVNQLVSSPIRNQLVRRERAAIRFALSQRGRRLARRLRRAVRGYETDVSWEMTHGPVFANVLASATFDGPHVQLVVEQTQPENDLGRGDPVLAAVIDAQL